MMMKNREMGGDFWDYSIDHDSRKNRLDWINNYGDDRRFLACGRTALDHIIRDILANHSFRSVYMPSYCCHTMIAPFVSNNIRVLFYDIGINKYGGLSYHIDFDTDCDAFLFMTYFGFSNAAIEDMIGILKNKNRIIIEDITHSLFSSRAYSPASDYLFTSFRKWTAIPGGSIAIKRNGSFSIEKPSKVHSDYIGKRKAGSHSKANYMKGLHQDPEQYLGPFREAEEILEHDYRGYTIDELSFDIFKQLDTEEFKRKRVENSRILIDGIRKNPCFDLIFKNISEGDCPLFIPVFVKNGLRNDLKKYLYEYGIYIPYHWVLTGYHKPGTSAVQLYSNELSLVCDQRYDKTDMEYFIHVLDSFTRSL